MHLEEAVTSPQSEATPPVPSRTPTSRRPPLAWVGGAAVLAAVVTGGVMSTFRTSQAPAGPIRSVVSAWPSLPPGPVSLITDLAISPDGSTIVYRTIVDGEPGVYVRRLDRLEGELLQGVANAGGFFFTGRAVGGILNRGRFNPQEDPGGRWCRHHTLPHAEPTAWCELGPDDTIIFARFAPGTGLFRVSAAGGEPEVLTAPGGVERHYWPELLPGGRAVLFTIGTSSNVTAETSQIAVFDLDTGEQRVLIEGGTHARYVAGHLVYSFGDTLRAVRFDANSQEVLSEPIPVLEGLSRPTTSGGANVDLSDNGSLVYQTGGFDADARRLVWVDRQGYEEDIPAEPHPYEAVRLAPDGRSVITGVDNFDDTYVLIYDLERDTPIRFTFDAARDIHPIVTPDGERVVFGSNRADGVTNLYWKAADGTGDVHRLTTSDDVQVPSSFTPDGKTLIIAAVTADGLIDLGALPMDGAGDVEWLLSEEFYEGYAEISPDGHWMAYASFESGQFEVYVRPFPNVQGGRRQVSRDGGFWPLWGPDGRELFYQTSGGFGAAAVTVMVAPIATEPTLSVGNAVPVFEGPYRRLQVNDPRPYDIAPDGQRFLMLKPVVVDTDARAEAAIILVQNWLDELTTLFPTSR